MSQPYQPTGIRGLTRDMIEALIAMFEKMTGEGFLHKEFLGDHPVLPVRFCSDVSEVIEMLEASLEAATPPTRESEVKLM